MSRDEGFRRADIDTDMLADPKILRLARAIRDPLRTAAAVCLYQSVVLASWRRSERLTLEEALPGWWISEDHAELGEQLAAAELLDQELRIPAHAWESWHGPALQRKLRQRQLGAAGGRASAEARAEARAEASAEPPAQHLSPSLSPGQPEPEPAQPRARAGPREGNGAALDPGGGERDALDAWADLTGSWPSPRVLPWLNELQESYGAAAVSRALAAEALASDDRRTLLGRTQTRLGALTHHERKRQEAEAIAERKRKEAEDRARIEAMPPEQRRANLARLRSELSQSGLLGPEKEAT